MNGRRVRRLFSSLNLLATITLLALFCLMANAVAFHRYARWDLTQDQITELSDQTRQVLSSLDGTVQVFVFFEPQHRLYEMVKDMFKEYMHFSPFLKVEDVDPTQDPARANQLVETLQLDELNLVVFQSGSRTKVLKEPDLAGYDYTQATFGGEPRLTSFKAEEAFTSAILSVTQATQPLIWITEGHGEKSVTEGGPSGLSDLKNQLEQQNMVVESKTLLEHSTIPSDVKLLVIPGAERRFHEQEISTLQKYLEQGGRCLILVDPLQETALEDFLKPWGVSIGKDIVVDPSRRLPFVSAANLFVTDYAEHPIVSPMRTLMTLYPLSRSVAPFDPPIDGLTVTALAFTSPEGWGETQTSVETFQYDEGTDAKGPVSIAVAVERTGPPSTRLVVIGDSDFIINVQLGNVGNKDLFLGAVRWLVDQERLIGISPKVVESIKLNLTHSQLRVMFWFSVLLIPLSFGALGILMWWLRRK